MSEELINKYWCKGTNREDKEPRYSHNWVSAKRAWFKIYSDHFECGSWNIKFDKINKINIYKSKQLFIPVKILHIITDKQSYQFGFNPWASPEKDITLNIEEQNINLKYSIFSTVLRIILLIYIIYWILDKILDN